MFLHICNLEYRLFYGLDGTFAKKLPHFVNERGFWKILFYQVIPITVFIVDENDDLWFWCFLGFGFLSRKTKKLYKAVTIVHPQLNFQNFISVLQKTVKHVLRNSRI